MPRDIDDYILTGRTPNPPEWPLYTVNMTAQELREWARNPRSALASTETGQQSLRRLPEVLQRPFPLWTPDDFDFTRSVAYFNTRHLRSSQLFGKEVGRSGWSKRHIALRNWGHDPSKDDSPAYAADMQWLREHPGAASRRESP